ncbi:MAG: MFS transporter [Anaerolineales bacterium]|nr:MFS transporter [Anaerolineales bacterium]
MHLAPAPTHRPVGMAAFLIVWVGQVISVLATNMTQFALTIWVYEQTGSVTALALVNVCFLTPFLLISPLAGALVDRHNRKLMMMVSDLAAGLGTLFLLAMQAFGLLQVWHLYPVALVAGVGNAFQWPAYSASISLMVPKAQLGRANGLMSLMEMGPGVLAPLLAGALLPLIGLAGVMSIDVVTFVLAVGALTFVVVPQPPRTAAGAQGRGSLLHESAFGLRYILARPSLLGLQLVFLFGNFFSGLSFTVLAPMVLARTGNNAAIFGATQSIGAVGGVVGGLAMGAWGGFKRRVHGVLLGWIVGSLFGQVLYGLGLSLPVWAVAGFVGALLVPIVNGSNQAIWQAKVAPDVQGRVFATRRLIAWLTTPLTPLIAGALADRVLEPGLAVGGPLVGAFGWLVGSGPGAGLALLVITTGALATAVGLLGYLFPAVRDAESRLPDHDAAEANTPAAAAASGPA